MFKWLNRLFKSQTQVVGSNSFGIQVGGNIDGMSGHMQECRYNLESFDAVIAISEDGIPSMMKFLSEHHWLQEAIKEFDDLAEHTFPDMLAGVYLATADCEGEGEDAEVHWYVGRPLFLIGEQCWK